MGGWKSKVRKTSERCPSLKTACLESETWGFCHPVSPLRRSWEPLLHSWLCSLCHTPFWLCCMSITGTVIFVLRTVVWKHKRGMMQIPTSASDAMKQPVKSLERHTPSSQRGWNLQQRSPVCVFGTPNTKWLDFASHKFVLKTLCSKIHSAYNPNANSHNIFFLLLIWFRTE